MRMLAVRSAGKRPVTEWRYLERQIVVTCRPLGKHLTNRAYRIDRHCTERAIALQADWKAMHGVNEDQSVRTGGLHADRRPECHLSADGGHWTDRTVRRGA